MSMLRSPQDELLKYENIQIKKTEKHLRNLGFKSDEVRIIINKIELPGLIIINTSYKSLKKLFLSTYNIKKVTPSVFIDWFDEYSSNWMYDFLISI
jgi:hypothetical protein